MSKTHKTKPYWVKLRQGIIPTHEYHDHRRGECNFTAPSRRWWSPGGCGLQETYIARNMCCSCCHYPTQRSEREQKQRRELRNRPKRLYDEYDSPEEEYAYMRHLGDLAEENEDGLIGQCPGCYTAAS